MHFRDFAPPADPTREDQRDALQKGLGRALQWARAGKLDADLLLEACLRDPRIGSHCAINRSTWLWKLLQITGHLQAVRAEVLGSLRRIADIHNADHLCGLAAHFAKAGDAEFLTALDTFFREQRFVQIDCYVGERQLLEAAGVDGLFTVAQLRGARLAGKDWEWDDACAVDDAIQVLGEDQLCQMLKTTQDADVRRFLLAWQAEVHRDHKTDCRSGSTEHAESLTLDLLVQLAHVRHGRFAGREWATTASSEQFLKAQERLWGEWDDSALARFLLIFRDRPLQTFDERLIRLSDHPNRQVCYAARRALIPNVHPQVRQFALRELADSTTEMLSFSLLTNNYVESDDELILSAIPFGSSPIDLFSPLADLIEFLRKTPARVSPRLGIAAHATTPCSCCRIDSVKRLLRDEAAPEWLLEECRNDCEEEIRELVDSN